MWKKIWEEEPVENMRYFVYSQSHGFEYATYGKLYGPYNQQRKKTHANNTRRLYHLKEPYGWPWVEDDYKEDEYTMGFIVGDGWSAHRKISDVLYFMEIPDLPEMDQNDAIKKQMVLIEARVERLEEKERIKNATK